MERTAVVFTYCDYYIDTLLYICVMSSNVLMYNFDKRFLIFIIAFLLKTFRYKAFLMYDFKPKLLLNKIVDTNFIQRALMRRIGRLVISAAFIGRK
jgi:hypothetical protein